MKAENIKADHRFRNRALAVVPIVAAIFVIASCLNAMAQERRSTDTFLQQYGMVVGIVAIAVGVLIVVVSLAKPSKPSNKEKNKNEN